MKRIFLLLLCLCGVVALNAATVDTLKIHSPKMNREINAYVVVPDCDTPMSTLYLLHGYSGNETTWARISDVRSLADQYDMLIVCPDGENSWYWDSPLREDSQFETFVVRELTAYIDKNYNTIADRTARAISGLSMGGHGAMWCALRNKDIFGAAGSMSGGLDIRPFPESWKMTAQLGELDKNSQRWDDHTAINALEGLRNGELAMIIDCGVDDFFLEVNRNFHAKLVEMGVSHDYIERAGAHTATYWKNSVVYQAHYFDRYFKAQTRVRNLRAEAAKSGVATIDNDVIRLQVSTLGAEMQSIVKHSTGREYLWQGDPTYWKYRASVLFPIVGAVCDNKYRLSGEEYNMTIHGIARDYDFEIVKHNQEEVVFKLVSTEEMKAKYPCDFVLEIGYKLVGDNVRVSYRVVNPSDETIHFQLGSHPGFNYRGYDETADVQGYIMFNDREADDKMSVSISNKDGFIVKKRGVIKLSEKMFPIMKSTFNRDALLFEGNQSKDIYLLDADKKPYVRVRHDSPVVGVWSKAYNGYAPFICIESLYGRCDDVNYKGAFEDKAWMQSLEPKGVFKSNISIWFGE